MRDLACPGAWRPARWSRRARPRPAAVELEGVILAHSARLLETPPGNIRAPRAAGSAPPGPGRRSRRRASPWPARPAAARPRPAAPSAATAFSVPTRQGVHWPQLSSSKNRIRFSATACMSSWSERTTTAAEPMKQPCGSSVPKSSGMSAMRRRQDAARGAARQVGLERVPVGHAAAIFVDQLARR